MPLTDTRLRALKPRPRLYRVADRDGLCIEVRTTGARLWRFRYRYAGKAQMVGLGEYPSVGLQEARKRLLAERERLAHGADPAAMRRQLRHAKTIAGDDSLKSVATEWLAKRKAGGWTDVTLAKHTQRLETWVYPYVGTRAMRSLTSGDLLLVVQRPERAAKIETAHRLKQVFGSLFRYAIATGRADADPSTALRGALVPLKVTHRASLKNPQAIGAMLRAIDGYTGRGVAATAALKLAPLVFVRPGELRKAEWAEFEFKSAQWRIPGERMKMGLPHLVPLSRQALAILKDLQPVTGGGRYVFPSLRTRARPLSENTINAALRRLGYTKEEMTAHGFRSIASTMLHEAGFNSDWIEAQLAHADPTVRGDYNFALYLQQRRKMMQAWADMLDRLREDRKVVKLRA
jgi:integrase